MAGSSCFDCFSHGDTFSGYCNSVSWQTQQEDYWCWAAISASIGGSTQCDRATAWASYYWGVSLPGGYCCSNGSNGTCDIPGYVAYSLHCTYYAGTLDFCDIIDTINSNAPIACGVPGHVVAISGYACYGGADDPQVLIWDPWYPQYGGGWRWVDYYTFCGYWECYYF